MYSSYSVVYPACLSPRVAEGTPHQVCQKSTTAVMMYFRQPASVSHKEQGTVVNAAERRLINGTTKTKKLAARIRALSVRLCTTHAYDCCSLVDGMRSNIPLVPLLVLIADVLAAADLTHQQAGYLFPGIAKRRNAYLEANPDCRPIISLGIGDTTQVQCRLYL